MIRKCAGGKRGGGTYRIFVSYSRKDKRYRQQLDINLVPLRRNGLISVWHDRVILPGQEWDPEIDKHLESADIVLVLVSPDFLASEYAYGREMSRALERHQSEETIVVPIILRPSDWQHSPLAALQALPGDGRPISSWPNRDQAWLDVVEGLRRLILD
jgi:internalin A